MPSVVPLFAFLLGASQTPTPNPLAISLFVAEVEKQEADRVLCLEVDGNDAPTDVLDAVQYPKRTIVLAHECVRSMSGSFQRITHRPATFISIENFQPISTEEAEVDLNRYVAGLSAIYETLEVHRDKEGWHVVRIIKHTEA